MYSGKTADDIVPPSARTDLAEQRGTTGCVPRHDIAHGVFMDQAVRHSEMECQSLVSVITSPITIISIILSSKYDI